MPWRPCVASRDTITQADGVVIPNAIDFSDAGFNHTVTSYCRTVDGTWITWINAIAGESFDNGISRSAALTIKETWPADIANAYALSVGFFPDDGTPATVYDLQVDPVYFWEGLPAIGKTDPCGIYPLLGIRYADVGKARLVGWGMDVKDVQVRTDGSNVWVVALARESVKYPFLYNSPVEVDSCGHSHPTFEEYWTDGHDDPFFHDYDQRNLWWTYFGSGSSGSMGNFDDSGDPGHIWGGAFRWEPARLTVWSGDLGGFTRIGTVEAKFGNSGGLVSGVEACASPAEPGVVHVMWSEAGYMGPLHAVNPRNGQRINYTRWDTGGNTLDADLFYSEEPATVFNGYVSDDIWVWTQEFILRNDHGAPIAIVCPIVAGAGIWSPSGPMFGGAAEFWDLSGGTANVIQTMDLSLYPTPDELGLTDVEVVANVTGQRRSQYASSLYVDPTLSDQQVYLIYVAYYDPSEQIGPSAEDGIVRQGCAFYRIPCDGSAPFDFMDGTRLVQYSVLPLALSVGFIQFGADFVSDPGNVWMPQMAAAGIPVWQLTRTCERSWFLDEGIVGTAAWDIASPIRNAVSPPSLRTDGAGDDWIAGGGYGPSVGSLDGILLEIGALQAKICRCCVPCIQRIGLHIWEKV